MSYWFGARLGIRHCSLCDITHSLFLEKSAWRECQQLLNDKHGVNFQAFHRDDQPDGVRRTIEGKYPALISQDESGALSLFMSEAEITACGKSPEVFFAAIILRLS